jgi:excisionase family DNA binding protein
MVPPQSKRRWHMEKLMLRPMEVAEAIGCGRSKIYALLAAGVLPSVRLGGRSVRVPARALREWVDKQLGTPARDEPAQREIGRAHV